MSDEQRIPPRDPVFRNKPDGKVRCTLCDAGLLEGEVWTFARECCAEGKKFDVERGVPFKARANTISIASRGALPDDDKRRLEYPMADGLLYYFPAALAEVSRVSKIGNDQHNPGLPLHWARSKSTDHENKILRHLLEAGTKDSKGVRHTARLAWRALALLQVELEREEGAPLPRNARF